MRNASPGPGIRRVSLWDASLQQYANFRRAPTFDGAPDAWVGETPDQTAGLWPGEALWIENGGDGPENAYFWGEVCLEENMDVPLSPGINGLAYPFTASADILGTFLPALGGANDELWRWTAGEFEQGVIAADGSKGWMAQHGNTAEPPKFRDREGTVRSTCQTRLGRSAVTRMPNAEWGKVSKMEP